MMKIRIFMNLNLDCFISYNVKRIHQSMRFVCFLHVNKMGENRLLHHLIKDLSLFMHIRLQCRNGLCICVSHEPFSFLIVLTHVNICVILSIEKWVIITLKVLKWKNSKEEKLRTYKRKNKSLNKEALISYNVTFRP